MMNESNTRKKDGDESFNLMEWLLNDVKLPQYRDAFLQNGFESPLECSTIGEEDLNTLGVVKIGHRRRMLVSCQKLADKWGLSSQVDLERPGKGSSIPSEGKEQKSGSNNVQSPDNIELAPVLPPKKAKLKPAPPARNMAEKEVNIDSAIQGKNSNVEVSNPTTHLMLTETLKPAEDTKDGRDTVHESTNSETTLSPGLLPGNGISEYEPIWEANEGEPLPLSPRPQTDVIVDKTIEPVDNNNANLDIVTTGKHDIANDEQNKQINNEVKKRNTSNTSTGVGPPPIPPRADLEDLEEKEPQKYVNISSTGRPNIAPPTNPTLPESKPSDLTRQEKVVPPERKVAPPKPPRKFRNKNQPVSMVIPSNQPLDPSPTRRSLGNINQVEKSYNDDGIYENEVFTNQAPEQVENKPPSTDEKRSCFDSVPAGDISELNDNNIYGNAENFQRAPVQPKIPALDEKTRKPIPVPRARSISDKSKEAVYDTIPDKSPVQSFVKKSITDTGNDGGSCTEDDLSGSDREEMPEKIAVHSEYETVNFPVRSPSSVPSRHSRKEGYLFKQGGQQNNKGWKKRWVVFDGSELRYYKDKEHTNESLQMVPVAIMKEVRIVTEDTKRARFDLACAGRTYMFALGTEQMDDIQVWAQILMSSIIQVRKEDETNVTQAPGGDMFDPDKKGYLKKQGNNVVGDWKKRYVAVKDGMFAYYHNYEDFIVASPINTIHMNIANVKMDLKSPHRFQLVTPHRTYLFQCEDEQELHSWIAALEKATQLALSDKTIINKVWENSSNRWCADCGEKDPVWASVNLVVCVCAQCIGVHRKLGVHSSKPRSLLMDEKIWSPSLIRLMVEVGNERSNKFWQYRLPEDDQISPESSSQAREEFIGKKYVQRMYRHVSPLFGDPVALGEELKRSVCTNDIEKTMQLVFCGADVKYISSDGSESRTPYGLAKAANQELQMELLMQNGAITVEQEPVRTPDSPADNLYETVHEIISPTTHYESPAIVYEKEGFLLKKAPSAAVWRKRNFMLKGRELWYDKGDKEGHGLIKLKDVEEYVYNDSLTLDIVTAERTYNLKAETREDALSWYTALHNKQVFNVPLECQELGSDGVPHLVAKSLQFVETHGLDAEGIYRKNGNKAKIRMLKKLFNQDAESVMILREDYEAHDVAGLLKEYFRELPNPLMTEDAYAHFITASLEHRHNEKLNKYKTSLGRLPEVNRTTLKTVINHLVRVSSKSEQNKMKLENISLIFGPTLMSNEQMGAMDTSTINQEFTVIGDFITYYQWLFDVDDDEMKKDKKIADAIKQLSQLSQLTSSSKSSLQDLNSLTLDIYAMSTQSECSRITVFSDTKASKICQELIYKRAMAPDLDWTLFQNVNGEIDRPFPATEKVLATVIETGKYVQLSKGSCLVVKENYVRQKIEAYALQNDTSGSLAGPYQTMKEGRKKESWKRLFVKLEYGNLKVFKTLKSKDDLDSWPLSETTLYVGVDRDKKPLTKFGFTIARLAKDGQCVYRYICFDEERELYKWINIFLKFKYVTVQDLWTDPDLEPIGFYAEALAPAKPPVPRQRTPSNKSTTGASANVLNELKERQMKKSIRK